MFKVALLGSSGRMGTLVTKLLEKEFKKDFKVVCSLSKTSDWSLALQADVLIDFSLPDASLHWIEFASKQKKKIPAFICGTTGWKTDARKKLEEFSKKTAVLWSSNFSTGVYLLSKILKDYTPTFEKLGYSPVIVETHHQHKKDAPSGTALTLRESIDPKNKKKILIHSFRTGEVIGNHEITFNGVSDHIILAHHALDRALFARGSIQAALWLAKKKKKRPTLKGWFKMEDFFGEL